MALPDGLYDLLLTEGLARSLAALDPISADVLALKGGAAEALADVITRQLSAILDDVAGDDSDKAKRQLELVNELLVMLRQRLHAGDGPAALSGSAGVVDLVASPLRVLRAVQRDQQFPASPEIGLAVPWLFTAGKGSPSLLQEIRRELASSDQVDILVSFITVSGVRKLQDVLQQITAMGGQGRAATRLRILTTTYTGATMNCVHMQVHALHQQRPPRLSEWRQSTATQWPLPQGPALTPTPLLAGHQTGFNVLARGQGKQGASVQQGRKIGHRIADQQRLLLPVALHKRLGAQAAQQLQRLVHIHGVSVRNLVRRITEAATILLWKLLNNASSG